MRTKQLAAALFLSASCALLTASCIQSSTAAGETDPIGAGDSDGREPIGEALQEAGGTYESKDFPFVVIVKDDGDGKAGGWQAADKTFHFMERNLFIPVYRWRCRIRIGMPLRPELWGPITSSRAALYSAEVANEVVDPLLESRPAWRNLGDEFCHELRARMELTFAAHYPRLGAKVQLNP